ncbi:hypothetical protein LCGC14_0220720 [marine sediment metagenome]|uniref:Uncharacterized protein n=1 Tax=marine sediment metagenome TaxID=412755 RepID=A0A0F9UHQ8_9ZZZZ
MNEKLIRRAAKKYRDWIVEKSQEINSVSEVTIRSYLETLYQKSEEMQKWSGRILKGIRQRVQKDTWKPNALHMGLPNKSIYRGIANGMVPDLGRDIISYTKNVVSMLKDMTAGNDTIFLSPKEAIEEIRIISQTWDKVEFRRNMLSVRINKVTLSDDKEEVELGDFWINLHLDNLPEGLTIQSINKVMSSRKFFHPHVKHDKLCTGDGTNMNNGNPMGEALSEGRLEDYFRIVEAILRTYNKESPHEELVAWYDPGSEDNHENEFHCVGCDEWCHCDDGLWCEGCSTIYCNDCADGVICIDCENWRCGECNTTCIGCSES